MTQSGSPKPRRDGRAVEEMEVAAELKPGGGPDAHSRGAEKAYLTTNNDEKEKFEKKNFGRTMIVDSACTAHLFQDWRNLEGLSRKQKRKLKYAWENNITSTGKKIRLQIANGDLQQEANEINLKSNNLGIKCGIFHQQVKHDLFSVASALDEGYSLLLDRFGGELYNGHHAHRIRRSGKMWTIDLFFEREKLKELLENVSSEHDVLKQAQKLDLACYMADGNAEPGRPSKLLLHQRQAHIWTSKTRCRCSACLRSKGQRPSHKPLNPEQKPQKPLELVSCDFFEWNEAGLGGEKFGFLMKDHFSGLGLGRGYSHKYMCAIAIDEWCELHGTPENIRSDCAREMKCKGSRMAITCRKRGIKQQFSAPYEAAQNGVIERHNRTIKDLVRSNLQGVCPKLWVWCLEYVIHAWNRIAKRPGRPPPFQKHTGKKCSTNHLRRFGCTVYFKQYIRKTAESKYRPAVFLGYDDKSKCHRVGFWQDSTFHVRNSYHCKFLENEMVSDVFELENAPNKEQFLRKSKENRTRVCGGLGGASSPVTSDDSGFSKRKRAGRKRKRETKTTEVAESQPDESNEPPAKVRKRKAKVENADEEKKTQKGRTKRIRGSETTEIAEKRRRGRPRLESIERMKLGEIPKTKRILEKELQSRKAKKQKTSSQPSKKKQISKEKSSGPVKKSPKTTKAEEPTRGKRKTLKNPGKIAGKRPTKTPKSTIKRVQKENIKNRVSHIANLVWTPGQDKPFEEHGMDVTEAEVTALMAEKVSPKEAMKCPKFLAADELERKTLTDLKCWVPISRKDLKAEDSVTPIVVIYNRKRDGRCKARGVALGNRCPTSNPEDVYSPTVTSAALRMAIIRSVKMGYGIKGFDIKAAFIRASLLDKNGTPKRRVVCRLPERWREKGDKDGLVLLHKTLYGLDFSPQCWNREMDSGLCRLGWSPSEGDPASYTKVVHDEGKSYCLYCGVHVDDGAMTGGPDKLLNREIDLILKEWDGTRIKEKLYHDGSRSLDILGVDVRWHSKSGWVQWTQSSLTQKITDLWGKEAKQEFPRKISHPTEKREEFDTSKPVEFDLRKLVGCLMYLQTQSRPDLAEGVRHVASSVAKPTVNAKRAALRLVKYLMDQGVRGPRYSRESEKRFNSQFRDDESIQEHDRVMLTAFSDASYGLVSISGSILFFGGCAIFWQSKRIRLQMLSSCEAEFVASFATTRELISLEETERRISNSPVVEGSERAYRVYVDNKSLLSIVANRHRTRRTRHMTIRSRFISDQIEAKRCKYHFVPGISNPADVLTKPQGLITRWCVEQRVP